MQVSVASLSLLPAKGLPEDLSLEKDF